MKPPKTATSVERRAFLAGLLTTPLGNTWAARAENIVLGQTLAIGAGSDGSASRIIDGAKACVGAVNARGGVNGRLIELVTLDGGRDATTHAQNARRLISHHGAVALLNCSGDAACLAVAQVARELQVPMVGAMSSSREMLRSRSRYQFPIRAGNDRQAEALSRQLRAMGVSRAALLTDQPGRSERTDTLKPMLDTAGVASTPIAIHPAERASFEAAMRVLGATPFHAVVVDVQPETIELLSEGGFTTRPEWPRMLASFASNTLIALSGAFPGRVIGFANVVPHAEAGASPLTQELNRNAEKYSTGHAINFAGFEAYINTRVCVEALRRIHGRPDAARLTEALEGLDRLDLGGFGVSFAAGRETGSDWVQVGVRSRDGFYLK